MIKILHFADIHLGVENYGRTDPATGMSSRLLDFLAALDQAVDHALQNRVDLALFAGDAYKTRDPTPTQQREFARRVRRLAEGGIPVFLLVGNHDTPNVLGKAHSVEIFDTLGVQDVQVARKPGTYRIETLHGPLQIVALPWVVKGALLAREEYKNLTLEELGEQILKKVADIIQAEVAALEPGVPALLAAHASVQGATYGSERSVMLGQDIVFPLGLLADPAFDYVALGHIHRHQVVNPGAYPPVVYSGSLERVDFGEEGQDKGFVVVDLGKGNTTFEFVPVRARPFVTIQVDARGTDPTQAVLSAISGANVAGAVVRVRVQMDPEQEGSFREEEVRRALRDADYVAGIAKEVQRPVRQRFGGRFAEQVTPLEALERYLEVTGTPPGKAQELLKYAQSLIQEVLAEGEG